MPLRAFLLPRANTIDLGSLQTKMKRDKSEAMLKAEREGTLSHDLVQYGRFRFCESADLSPSSRAETLDNFEQPAVSKTSFSPYVFPVQDVSPQIPKLPSLERSRTQLMNQIRTRRIRESIPVTSYHDHLTQELIQEGDLTSKYHVMPITWPTTYSWRFPPRPQIKDMVRLMKNCQETLWGESNNTVEEGILPDKANDDLQVRSEGEAKPPKVTRISKQTLSVSSISSAEKHKITKKVKNVKKTIKEESLRLGITQHKKTEENAQQPIQPGKVPAKTTAVPMKAKDKQEVPDITPDEMVQPPTVENVDPPKPSTPVLPTAICPSSSSRSRYHEARMWVRYHSCTYPSAHLAIFQ